MHSSIIRAIEVADFSIVIRRKGGIEMNYNEFLSSLNVTQRKALLKRRDAKGLWHLAGHRGAFVLCAVLIFLAVPLWQVMLPVLGILLVFLSTLLHEPSHKTPFKTCWTNEVVGHVCRFVLFVPLNWVRYFYFVHHRFTQIPGRDPELDAAKPSTWGQYIRPANAAWNMPCHTEHHSYPSVPFYKLPDLIKQHLAVTANGTATFNKGYDVNALNQTSAVNS